MKVNDIQDSAQLLRAFYQEVEVLAYQASPCEREKRGLTDKAFVYGEVDFVSFLTLLGQVQPQEGELFCDFGSGAGKAVFAAALHYPYLRCRGVEYLESLHEIACWQRQIFCRQLAPSSQIELLCADMFEQPLDDVDIALISATCFDEAMMKKTLAWIEDIKRGARLLILSHPLKSPSFSLLGRGYYPMGWNCGGSGTLVHVYRKL